MEILPLDYDKIVEKVYLDHPDVVERIDAILESQEIYKTPEGIINKAIYDQEIEFDTDGDGYLDARSIDALANSVYVHIMQESLTWLEG